MIIRLSESDADLVGLAISNLLDDKSYLKGHDDYKRLEELLELFEPQNRTDQAVI